MKRKSEGPGGRPGAEERGPNSLTSPCPTGPSQDTEKILRPGPECKQSVPAKGDQDVAQGEPSPSRPPGLSGTEAYLTAAAEAKVMLQAGVTLPEVVNALRDWTRGRCVPPLSDNDLLLCIESSWRALTCPTPAPPGNGPRLRVVNVHDLLALDLPERGHVLSPVIPEQGLAMLYAPRGLGKTWAGLSIAYAVASGQKAFGRWEALRPRRVLYLDGEMPVTAMRERIASIVQGYEAEPPDPDYLRLLTPDLQKDYMPNLAKEEGQAAIAPFLEGIDLVVVDNLATLGRYGKENEAESWTPLQTWILSLRRQGKSVLLIHHAGKGGSQRGTSAREDVLDTVIALRWPEDYQAEQGARFEVHLEKARGVCGPEARPFEAVLRLDQGAAQWLTNDLADVELERVRQLKADGMTVREIAEETGMSRSRVGRMVKKLDGGQA